MIIEHRDTETQRDISILCSLKKNKTLCLCASVFKKKNTL